MKRRIIADSLAREFRLLRNRVEAQVHAPAVILVTSATDRDGTELTAFGLAESLSKTHQRAVLVTTGNATPKSPEWVAPAEGTALRNRRASDRLDAATAAEGRLKHISISAERLTTISRNNVAELVEGLRAEYDYVVIDVGDLPNNSFGLLLAASADAVLVAFLSGRQQVDADRAMLDTLEKSEAKTLGVVMTDQVTIERFDGYEDEATVVVAHPNTVPTIISETPGPAAPLLQRLEVALQRLGKFV